MKIGRTSCRVVAQSKFHHNVVSLWRTMVLPRFVRRWQRRWCLSGWESRPDADIIRQRVDYYCRISAPFDTAEAGKRIGDIKLSDMHSSYYYDLMRYLRSYPRNKRVACINGDTHVNPEVTSFGKARRLNDTCDTVALLKLNRRRHFYKVRDNIPFGQKKGILFFRGDVDIKDNRRSFLERWWGHPLFDIGDTSPRTMTLWHTDRVPIEAHLQYKYILAPEGHDVASALQWICASNCIPVMTRPTVESWLMHARMVPGVHYIEVKDDFSDAAEKIEWYNDHPAEARKISEASKEWVRQFEDTRRENIIQYLVVERYLRYSV